MVGCADPGWGSYTTEELEQMVAGHLIGAAADPVYAAGHLHLAEMIEKEIMIREEANHG